MTTSDQRVRVRFHTARHKKTCFGRTENVCHWVSCQLCSLELYQKCPIRFVYDNGRRFSSVNELVGEQEVVQDVLGGHFWANFSIPPGHGDKFSRWGPVQALICVVIQVKGVTAKMSRSLPISGHTLVLESLKLGPRVKPFKEENDSNNLKLSGAIFSH